MELQKKLREALISLRGMLKFLIISRFFMRLRAPQMGRI